MTTQLTRRRQAGRHAWADRNAAGADELTSSRPAGLTSLRFVGASIRRRAWLAAAIVLLGLIVTAGGTTAAPYDFVSRFFSVDHGVPEDPVCGSAHCCLVNFWRKRLGKSEFVAFQVSARGGVVKVRVVKDRVFLSGRAVTVAKGELLVEGDVP